MSKTQIRVLVVDDSALMRRVISDSIAAEPDMAVVGTGTNGLEAVEKVLALKPDVVTLDVQMPGMDGLAALEQILAKRPTPVIMVSSLTRRAADVTLNALERGAIDYVAKPETAAQAEQVLRGDLIRKIRGAYGADVARVMQIRKRRRPAHPAGEAPPTAAATHKHSAHGDIDGLCITIGISTGGPPALVHLFESLAPPMPPIVVVQHMPAQFTGSFAKRLDAVSDLSIKEAEHGEVVHANHVYIAPGGLHLGLRHCGHLVHVDVHDGEPVGGHKPSVDSMMQSAAHVYGDHCLGVVMTGMGHDGVEGCRAIKESGGYVLAQDRESSDVYGMNKLAIAAGHVDAQFSLDNAAAAITASLAKLRCGAPA
jgi:two-component system chemotaxis response regulator CheB